MGLPANGVRQTLWLVLGRLGLPKCLSRLCSAPYCVGDAVARGVNRRVGYEEEDDDYWAISGRESPGGHSSREQDRHRLSEGFSAFCRVCLVGNWGPTPLPAPNLVN